MAKGNAKQLGRVWQTKIDNMLSGEISLESLDQLVKAAKIGKHDAVKLLCFTGTSQGGKRVLDILAEPCDPYVRADGKKSDSRKTATW